MNLDARLRQILARAAEQPDHREPVLIFADALLEANEPYGEFIVRSVRGETERAEELRRKHERHWLGPLRRYFAETEYRLGLLCGAAIAREFADDALLLAEALRHPLLGLVRRLSCERSPVQRIHRTSVDHYLRFVCADGARQLAEVDGSHVAVLDLLIDGAAPKVTRLADVRLNRQTLQRLARVELDRIDQVEITVTRQLTDVLERLATEPAFRRRRRAVKVFHAGYANSTLVALEYWPQLDVASLDLGLMELRREAEGVTMRLSSTSALGGYAGDLNPDPYWASVARERVPDLTRIVFGGPQPLAESLALARQLLPRVRFEMADGSEAIGRQREQPVAAPPPERPREERPEIPPQPPSDPDGVTALILRGELDAAKQRYASQYGVDEGTAERKVGELQLLLRPPSSFL